MKKIIFSLSALLSVQLAFSCSSRVSTISSESNTYSPGDTSSGITAIEDKSLQYKNRYGLKDPYTKLVDNRGNGYEDLYGVRNFRVVLHGVFYRGGANNSYNTVDGKRSNSNPLQKGGLKNLCEEGFGQAIYLYSTNFSSAPKQMDCKKSAGGEPNQLKYQQISGLNKSTTASIVKKAYNVIKGTEKGPIYSHCWNGWHASGYVASAMLKQFCGYTDEQALSYWIKNTDGNSTGYDSVKKLVTAFKPLPEYKITAEEKRMICPN